MNIFWAFIKKSVKVVNEFPEKFIVSIARSVEKKLGKKAVKVLKFLYNLGFGVALCVTIFGLILAGSNYRVMAQSSPWPVNGSGVPNIGEVNSRNFVTFDRDQCFPVDQQAAHLIGGSTELCTKKGGDFSDLPISFLDTMFKAGDEPLDDLLKKGGADPNNTTIDQLSFAGKSNLQDFVKSIGQLQSPISPIVKAQLADQGLTVTSVGRNLIPTNEQVFSQFPQIANNPFNVAKLGSSLKVSQVPGLGNTQVKNIAGALGEKINKFPGLDKRVFGSFPTPPQVPSAGISFVKMNLILKHENISGNGRIITDAPCTDKCDGFEIVGMIPNSPENGERVVSGDNKSARSRDGHGFLNNVGGDAPTGDFPLGKSIFKRSFHDINAEKGTASWALNFHICQEGLINLGCTPNFIGPFRVGVLTEKSGEVFMKNGIANSLAANPVASTTKAASSAWEQQVPANPLTSPTAIAKNVIGVQVAGIDVTKLGQAFKNADIPNINQDQLKAKIAEVSKDNTLDVGAIVKKAALDLVGGSNIDPRAVNPVTGQSAAEIAKRVAAYYDQNQ